MEGNFTFHFLCDSAKPIDYLYSRRAKAFLLINYYDHI